jgi:hypothetical protein
MNIKPLPNVTIADINYTPRVWEDESGRPYSWTSNGY